MNLFLRKKTIFFLLSLILISSLIFSQSQTIVSSESSSSDASAPPSETSISDSQTPLEQSGDSGIVQNEENTEAEKETLPITDKTETTVSDSETDDDSQAETASIDSMGSSGSSSDPKSYKQGVDDSFVPNGVNKPEGSFNANLQTGAATYSYSIIAPPGTNGMAPSVSLSYNSQSAKSIPGMLASGWSVTENYIQRDANYTFSFSNDDEFILILNGQSNELIPMGNNKYKTKIETYSDIQFNGDYWIVRTKDGTTYTFGKSAETRIDSNQYGYRWRWYLELVNDTHGNSMNYTYRRDPCANDIGVLYPHYIYYDSKANTRQVVFYLDGSPYPRLMYVNGHKQRYGCRIAEIQTYANGLMVSRYVFTFELDEIPTITYLTKITRYGSNNGDPSSTTSFTYNTAQKGFIENTSFIPPENLLYNEKDTGLRFADLNGDGLTDFFTSIYTSVETKLVTKAYINNGSGWTENNTFAIPIPLLDWVQDKPLRDYGTRFADLNGDGKTDFFYHNSDNFYPYTHGKKALLNNGSGFIENDSFIPPTDLYSIWEDGTRFDLGKKYEDLNGDGLTDFFYSIHIDSNNQIAKAAYINNGSGYIRDDTLAPPLPLHDEVDSTYKPETGVRFVDLNGDGLLDFLYSNLVHNPDQINKGAYINTGSGYVRDDSWAPPMALIDEKEPRKRFETGVRFGDLNGDGLVDLFVVIYDPENKNLDKQAWMNTGAGWKRDDSYAPPINMIEWHQDYLKDLGVRIADLNGDGLIDFFQRKRYDYGIDSGIPAWEEKSAYINKAQKRNLLIGVKNSFGGVINITYKQSTLLNNTGEDGIPDLSYNVWVVDNITYDNGMPGSQNVIERHTFNYSGGLQNYTEKEFMGFAYVEMKNPDNTLIKHYFHQDVGRKGMEYKTELYDSSGKVYSRNEYLFETTQSNGVYSTLLKEEKMSIYDGKDTPKTTKSTYEYDQYGNMIKQSSFGDVSVSGDEKYTYTEYLYNTDGWILNNPKHGYSYYGQDSSSGKYGESWFRYDGQAYGTAPTKGDLTYKEDWSNTSSNPVTQYGYDSHGNLVNVTDPLGRVSKTLYGVTDITYTFPEKTINALGHTASFTYDVGTGNMLSSTDPNGYAAYYKYDSLGRMIKDILPYDVETSATMEVAYLFDGKAPEAIKASKKGDGSYIKSIAYYDGFGRIIQLKSDSEESGKQIISDVFHDSKGRVVKQSLPYLASTSDEYATPSGSLFTNYEYDAVDRLAKIINPDNSFRKWVYDRWTISSYDENNQRSDLQYDGRGRISQVKEYNSTDIFTTSYEYNGMDQVIKITDNKGNLFLFQFDSLGRMAGMIDSDMGTWKYYYDKNGNLIGQKDNRGKEKNFTYDSLNRILNKTEDGAFTKYTYDEIKGTLTKEEFDIGFSQYYYDQRLRKTKETNSLDGKTWTSEWTYDSADRIKTYKKPDGRTYAYAYNLQGQLESISGIIENINYNPLNKVTFKDFGTVETTLTYHSTTQRLIRIQSPSLQDLNYEYDSEGNILTIKDSILPLNWTFRYDALDRLIQATENNTRSQNFAYDSIGNMLLFSTPEANVTYTYGTRPHAVERTEEV